jgi:hypothetical protein
MTLTFPLRCHPRTCYYLEMLEHKGYNKALVKSALDWILSWHSTKVGFISYETAQLVLSAVVSRTL